MKKIIAFYLPQFHSFKENDIWWGKGFTEWNNVKKGSPLFKKHNQPRVPLNNNYYCLLDKNVQIWQAELAKKYGIYGFCYYHYWFNGKILMDQPLLNMLDNADIDIKFCLSWANESWSRTWNGNDKDYLIKQEYSGKDDWQRHFDYLVKYFKDPRYIRINNKPMFLLYTSSRISNCEEMIAYWNERCIEEGFDGIYVVETLNYLQNRPVLNASSAIVCFEPNNIYESKMKKRDIFSSLVRYLKKNLLKKPNCQDIEKAYTLIEKREFSFDKIIYEGTFNDWDNTARKGYRGMVWKGACPELFANHLKNMIKKKNVGEFLFINAWNEWGEGAYLEPDNKHEYGYLEAIYHVMNVE